MNIFIYDKKVKGSNNDITFIIGFYVYFRWNGAREKRTQEKTKKERRKNKTEQKHTHKKKTQERRKIPRAEGDHRKGLQWRRHEDGMQNATETEEELVTLAPPEVVGVDKSAARAAGPGPGRRRDRPHARGRPCIMAATAGNKPVDGGASHRPPPAAAVLSKNRRDRGGAATG